MRSVMVLNAEDARWDGDALRLSLLLPSFAPCRADWVPVSHSEPPLNER
jgi:hypothetical protein